MDIHKGKGYLQMGTFVRNADGPDYIIIRV